MKDKSTRVVVSWESVGVHFGCVGVVRRASDRRVIHRTDPHPYGFHWPAMVDAADWAIDHGYIHIAESLKVCADRRRLKKEMFRKDH